MLPSALLLLALLPPLVLFMSLLPVLLATMAALLVLLFVRFLELSYHELTLEELTTFSHLKFSLLYGQSAASHQSCLPAFIL